MASQSMSQPHTQSSSNRVLACHLDCFAITEAPFFPFDFLSLETSATALRGLWRARFGGNLEHMMVLSPTHPTTTTAKDPRPPGPGGMSSASWWGRNVVSSKCPESSLTLINQPYKSVCIPFHFTTAKPGGDSGWHTFIASEPIVG